MADREDEIIQIVDNPIEEIHSSVGQQNSENESLESPSHSLIDPLPVEDQQSADHADAPVPSEIEQQPVLDEENVRNVMEEETEQINPFPGGDITTESETNQSPKSDSDDDSSHYSNPNVCNDIGENNNEECLNADDQADSDDPSSGSIDAIDSNFEVLAMNEVSGGQIENSTSKVHGGNSSSFRSGEQQIEPDKSIKEDSFETPEAEVISDVVRTVINDSVNDNHSHVPSSTCEEKVASDLNPKQQVTDQSLVDEKSTVEDQILFVADDIENLIKKSVLVSSQLKKKKSESIVDPSCLKEMAKSSEKMVQALYQLLHLIQKQLHSISVLATGYVQVHRDIGFKVTESVDDLLRGLYCLIAKIEQIDLQITPVYQLHDQMKRLRKSLEILDGSL